MGRGEGRGLRRPKEKAKAKAKAKMAPAPPDPMEEAGSDSPAQEDKEEEEQEEEEEAAPEASHGGGDDADVADAKEAPLRRFEVLGFPHLGLNLKLRQVYEESELRRKCGSDQAKLRRLEIALKKPDLFKEVRAAGAAPPAAKPAKAKAGTKRKAPADSSAEPKERSGRWHGALGLGPAVGAQAASFGRPSTRGSSSRRVSRAGGLGGRQREGG
ncbi:ubiB [Symbiodinium necroappetens]|uniref:UbiB protein n=1 Tax=Symbiodinium necroappetens TaxID=1628268 RepID=A0A813C3S1_9DINO|nr:ubiB [Symbiodinium necroappetens]